MEEEAERYFDRIEELGGVIPAIEKGFFQREIAESAYRYQQEVERGERVIVGVNRYVVDEPYDIPILKVDEEGERRQIERLRRLRERRDNQKVQDSLRRLKRAAEGEENLMPYILDCVKNYATLGETTDVLREVFGEYREPVIF